jgi:hypothetical protein
MSGGAQPQKPYEELVAERDELLAALDDLVTIWRDAFPYLNKSPSFQRAVAAVQKSKGES